MILTFVAQRVARKPGTSPKPRLRIFAPALHSGQLGVSAGASWRVPAPAGSEVRCFVRSAGEGRTSRLWTRVEAVAGLGRVLFGLPLLALGVSDQPLGAQRAPTVPVALENGPCAERLHAWTAQDESPERMPTFGVPLAESGSLASHAAIGAESYVFRGPVLAGASQPTDDPIRYDYDGPRRRDDRALALRGRVSLVRGAFVFAADVATDGRAVDVHALGLSVERGPVLAYAGALTARTGPSCEGGVVLSGTAALAWGEGSLYGVQLLGSPLFRLPVLGTTSVGLQLGALAEASPGNRHPLFHTMRVELQPSADLVLGLSRAVIFGGSETHVPVTLRTLALMLVGVTDTSAKDSDFENQVAAVDARWRARLWGRPLLLTAEYGADDSGYAFLHVPGVRVAGEWGWSPLGSGWTGLSVTHLARPEGTYPPWYRHGALAWGWTDRGWPLGSLLGGSGTAALLTYRRDGARLSIDVGAGPVDRSSTNLFSPDLEGRGWLAMGSARGVWRAWTWSLHGVGQRAGRGAAWASLSLMRAVGGSREAGGKE